MKLNSITELSQQDEKSVTVLVIRVVCGRLVAKLCDFFKKNKEYLSCSLKRTYSVPQTNVEATILFFGLGSYQGSVLLISSKL